jgi:hypothetical protein
LHGQAIAEGAQGASSWMVSGRQRCEVLSSWKLVRLEYQSLGVAVAICSSRVHPASAEAFSGHVLYQAVVSRAGNELPPIFQAVRGSFCALLMVLQSSWRREESTTIAMNTMQRDCFFQ